MGPENTHPSGPEFPHLWRFIRYDACAEGHADAAIEPLDKNRLTASSLDSPGPDE